MGPPASLLMGLAIENMSKALLVQAYAARGEAVVVNGRLLQRLTSGHAVVDLLKEAAVELDQNERDLVDRLRESVIWAGRYPVPKTMADYAPAPTGPSRAVPEAPSRWDKAVFDQLVRRLWHLAEERSRTPDASRVVWPRLRLTLRKSVAHTPAQCWTLRPRYNAMRALEPVIPRAVRRRPARGCSRQCPGDQ